jgi:deazaflavin-dependent oxidoreductase (nitroreductase family)
MSALAWPRKLSTRQPPRGWLGIRSTPGRLALLVFRLPVRLYRRGWGWLLGRTFLQLTHVGRKTGVAHDTIAMVLADDAVTGEVTICSAWGPDADWLRNLRAGPAREVRIGRDRYSPAHRCLSDDEAVAVAVAFRRRHPWRLRLLCAVLGWGDLTDDAKLLSFVQSHPLVALRPAVASGDREESR